MEKAADRGLSAHVAVLETVGNRGLFGEFPEGLWRSLWWSRTFQVRNSIPSCSTIHPSLSRGPEDCGAESPPRRGLSGLPAVPETVAVSDSPRFPCGFLDARLVPDLKMRMLNSLVLLSTSPLHSGSGDLGERAITHRSESGLSSYCPSQSSSTVQLRKPPFAPCNPGRYATQPLSGLFSLNSITGSLGYPKLSVGHGIEHI